MIYCSSLSIPWRDFNIFKKNLRLVILTKLLKVTKLFQLNLPYYNYHHVSQN